MTASNREASTLAGRPELWPGPLACLVGPPGSGKTRLADARFAVRPPVLRLDPALFDDPGRAGALMSRALAECCLFDDADTAFKRASAAGAAARDRLETGLFHLINRVAEGRGRLLLTARTPPSRWTVALPDLRTRLGAALVLRIDAPDDALMVALLENGFRERGLKVSDEAVAVLALRIERSAAAAARAVAYLDATALRQRRPIDAKMIRSARFS